MTSKSEIKRLATLDPGKLAERIERLERVAEAAQAYRVAADKRAGDRTLPDWQRLSDLWRALCEALDALGGGQ